MRFIQDVSPSGPILDVVDIEISPCNLRCAMCPTGGGHGLVNKRQGMMDPELFRKIIDKFIAEKVTVKCIWFGNWGEPLLNPLFPEMVGHARSRLPRTSILVFTNLTCLGDPMAIVESGLDDVEVSISGMSQETYSRNHIGGNVETVLANLKTLAAARDRTNPRINLTMKFHDYVYNKDEQDAARAFCESHGITFVLLRCYIPCVESNIRFHSRRERWLPYYAQYIDIAREQRLMEKLDGAEDCPVRESSLTIDFDGRFYRCTGVYEDKYLAGSLFDQPIAEIAGMKSEICELCARTPISWRRPKRVKYQARVEYGPGV